MPRQGAGGQVARSPGGPLWAPSRPAQREKDLGVGNEEVPRRLPAPRSKPVPKSHEQLWHLLLKDRYSRLRQNKSLGRCAVEGCLRAFSGWMAGRRGSPSLGLGGLCARTGLTLSVPNLRRATCSSVARAPCTLPSAQPWGSVGAAGACGAPGTLGVGFQSLGSALNLGIMKAEHHRTGAFELWCWITAPTRLPVSSWRGQPLNVP